MVHRTMGGELSIQQELFKKAGRPAEIRVRYCPVCQKVTRIINGHCDECGSLAKEV